MRTSKLSIPFCTACKNQVFCQVANPLHIIGDALRSRKVITYDKGEYLYYKDDRADGIFCIYSGEVKIIMPVTPSQEITVHVAGNGEMIGLSSLREKRHIYSAVATQDTEACFIKLSDISDLLKWSGTLSQKIESGKY
ncbi:MAG TPA: cyclic nucleotide-binding domain-containing protein [Bacteroidia bacterium]|nr:cyclic nucleotide-binding domain-containing protein [Bacteroidia bacterium]